MDKLSDVNNVAGWLPIRIYWSEGQPMVDWCQPGKERFVDSFFDETIERCLSDPFNLLFRQQTPIAVLGQRSEVSPGLDPAGFIFHMSRSGSTLISQLLAALPRNIVISEAPPIDATLRAHFKSAEVTDEQRITWLRWLLSALSQPRSGEQKLFVKFDAWHILDLPLIRRAFPRVPWIFVYRDPVEVMVSQLAHRGAHTIPGVIAPSSFGMNPDQIWTIEPEEYCARVLAALCQAALQHHGSGGLLVNYRQLPEIVWTSLAEFFGIDFSDAEVETMKDKTKRHAKNPAVVFQNDSVDKRRKATEKVLDVINTWIGPVYRELEAARLSAT
ncbi:MAG: sulfotransferase [bacterium]